MPGQSYTILKIQFFCDFLFYLSRIHLVQKQDSSSSKVKLPVMLAPGCRETSTSNTGVCSYILIQ